MVTVTGFTKHRADRAANSIAKLVRKSHEFSALDDISVDSKAGCGRIYITFTGNLNSENRSQIRSFLMNGFPQKIHPFLENLGWSGFRVRTNPRGKRDSRWTWDIEPLKKK